MREIDSLFDRLRSDHSVASPSEVMHGQLMNPVRVEDHCGDSFAGLAVLHWRGRLYLMKYDYSGQSGCPSCLAGFVAWQQVNEFTPDSAEPVASTELWEQLGPSFPAVVMPLARALLDDECPSGTLFLFDPVAGTVQRRSVPARTGCSCDTGELAATAVQFDSETASLVKRDGQLRGPKHVSSSLISDYVGGHTLFTEPLIDLDASIATAQVGVPLAKSEPEPTAGRSRWFGKSRITAVLEGLERYAGFYHRASSGRIVTTYRQLDELAIDPSTLGYHSDSQYAQEGFPFSPLGKDEVVNWVEVTSLRDGAIRYLPEMALYWAKRPQQRKALFSDTSNGFALGQTPEEAALHGLLELVERDAFMLTWYRKLFLPEIILGPQDGELRELVERVELFTGFRVRLFSATIDTQIPVVIALAQREVGAGSTDPGPCRFLSADANLEPKTAAESAIVELAGLVTAVSVDYRKNLDRAEHRAQEWGLVRTMTDHTLVGALPSSARWFDFLTDPERPARTLSSLKEDMPRNATIREDLDYVRSRVESAGGEVFAADVTTPELKWRDFVCVRAFAPGLLPMTFGHDMRRMEGLPRLDGDSLPYESRLRPDESPWDVPPHPFA